MKFDLKYPPPKRDWGPTQPISFGEVEWNIAQYQCHNWPCNALTGWTTYIEDADGVHYHRVCSEECLLALRTPVVVVPEVVPEVVIG